MKFIRTGKRSIQIGYVVVEGVIVGPAERDPVTGQTVLGPSVHERPARSKRKIRRRG